MGKHLLKGTLVLIVVTLIAGCSSGPIGKLPAIADWSGSGKRADFLWGWRRMELLITLTSPSRIMLYLKSFSKTVTYNSIKSMPFP